MRRQTKPFALLAAAIASKSAYAGIVYASGTPTVTNATEVSPTNFAGSTTGGSGSTQMLIPFDVTDVGLATTSYTVAASYAFGAMSLGADFILWTGLKLISKQASPVFNVRITSLTLSDGMTATAVFTFSGSGQLLTFSGESSNMGIQTPSSSSSNTLTGTGTQGSWVTSGGFSFGATTITNISFDLTALQAVDSSKDTTLGFHLDAIQGSAVPEPSSLALFGAGAGFAGIWVARRRKSRARTA